MTMFDSVVNVCPVTLKIGSEEKNIYNIEDLRELIDVYLKDYQI
jgi:hypothetical protein